jgi:hypothetical protein
MVHVSCHIGLTGSKLNSCPGVAGRRPDGDDHRRFRAREIRGLLAFNSGWCGERFEGGAAHYLSPEPARRRGRAAVLTDVRRNNDRRRARRSYGVLAKQELTVITQEASARSETVPITGIDGYRRRRR